MRTLWGLTQKHQFESGMLRGHGMEETEAQQDALTCAFPCYHPGVPFPLICFPLPFSPVLLGVVLDMILCTSSPEHTAATFREGYNHVTSPSAFVLQTNTTEHAQARDSSAPVVREQSQKQMNDQNHCVQIIPQKAERDTMRYSGALTPPQKNESVEKLKCKC